MSVDHTDDVFLMKNLCLLEGSSTAKLTEEL